MTTIINRYFVIIALLLLIVSCKQKNINKYIGYNVWSNTIDSIIEDRDILIYYDSNIDSSFILKNDITTDEKNILKYQKNTFFLLPNASSVNEIKIDFSINSYINIGNKKESVILFDNKIFDPIKLQNIDTYTCFTTNNNDFLRMGTKFYMFYSQDKFTGQLLDLSNNEYLNFQISELSDEFPIQAELVDCNSSSEEEFMRLIYELPIASNPVRKVKIDNDNWIESIINVNDTLYVKKEKLIHFTGMNYFLRDKIIYQYQIRNDTLKMESSTYSSCLLVI